GDEHGNAGGHSLAGGPADAHDRLVVHRADVRRSSAGPRRGAGDDRTDSVHRHLVALRGGARILPGALRGGARRTVLQRLRARPSAKTLPARIAADDRRDHDPVLLLLARTAGQLADPGANPAAVRVAVRGGDPAAPFSAGHRQAVPDVALPAAGADIAGDVALHLLRGAG